MAVFRVGVVGCGNVAMQVYLPGLRLLADAGKLDLAAVCDAVEDRVQAASDQFGVPQVFVDYGEMLARGEIDIVVNLTPMQAHTSCTLQALAANKHVYTEKPITGTLQEADRVIEAARASGLKLAAAPAVLLHPEIGEVKRLIDRGALGKICFIRSVASHAGPAWLADFTTDPTWFYKPGGGPVFDLGVYPLQMITGLLGPARRVTAFSGVAIPQREVRAGVAKGKRIDVEVDDNTHIMLDFGDACFAILDTTFCVLSAKGPRMELFGSKGVLNLYSRPEETPMEIFRDEPELGLRGWMKPEPVYRGSLMPAHPKTPPPAWTFAAGVSHLIDCIEQDRDPIISGEHARHVLEIMLKASESARRGEALPLETTFPPRLGVDEDAGAGHGRPS